MHYIKQLDQFGIPIELTHKEKSKYKSICGGFTSFVIYSISLAYTIYYIIQLQSGNVLANVQTSISTQKEKTILIDELLSIGEINSKVIPDPFSLNNNIFTVFVFTITGHSEKEITSEPLFSNIWREDQNRPLIGLNQVTLSSQVRDQFEQSNFYLGNQKYLIFSKCKDEVISQYNGTCASKEMQKTYYDNNTITFDVNVKLKSYNSDINNFNEYYKTYFVGYDQKNVMFSQILLQTTKVVVDNGLLFQQENEQIVISGFDYDQSIMDEKFGQFYFGLDIMTIISLRLDTSQMDQRIIFPKLGEILASIGSVIEVLLLIQYVITPINEILLNKEFILTVLEQYYPDFKFVKLYKNAKCEFIKVNLPQGELDLEDFKEFYIAFEQKIRYHCNLSLIIAKLLQLEQIIDRHISVSEDEFKIPVRWKLVTNNQIQLKIFEEQKELMSHKQ